VEPGSPGWKKFGSGINIPDSQHCFYGVHESSSPAYVAPADRYDNPIPTRFLAPIDCTKFVIPESELLLQLTSRYYKEIC